MTLPVKAMELPLPITLGISHFGGRDNFLYSQDGGKSGQDSEARIDPKCGISGHARVGRHGPQEHNSQGIEHEWSPWSYVSRLPFATQTKN